MELRPISFQSNMTHLSFSQYYKSFMDSECKNDSVPENSSIEAQRFEVARRQLNLHVITEALKVEWRANVKYAATRKREHFEIILLFIELLENDFVGPPQWLCTSHYDIVFYHHDYQDISDTPEDGSAAILFVRAIQDASDNWKLVLSSTYSSTGEIYEVQEAAVTAAKLLREKTPSCQ
jgi:hypothetical protein